MSDGSGRFMFAGHATGVAARFHRLDDTENLNHVVPMQGSSVVPVSGGRSNHLVEGYRFDVDAPRRRCLIRVDRVETLAEGRDTNGSYETEVSATVTGLHIVEKLHCDLVRMHMVSTYKDGGAPLVTTAGNRLDGLRLGDIGVKVTFDEAPLANAGNEDQFLAWHGRRGKACGSFAGHRRSTIVRDIELIGNGPERQNMTVDGNVIRWVGFGRIILGELHVKGNLRRLTLVRLEMGSDAGGDGSAGDGQSNGGAGTN
jgi:hypothetical protein